MNSERWLAVLFVASAATIGGLLSYPSSAYACPPPQCIGGELRQAGATIPSTSGGLIYRPNTAPSEQKTQLDPSKVKLNAQSGGTFEEVPVSIEPVTYLGLTFFQISPASGFMPNTDYKFRGIDFCEGNGTLGDEDDFTATFSTSEDANLPESLGDLVLQDSARGQITVTTISGSCVASADAEQRSVSLEINPKASKWNSEFFYATEIKRPSSDEWRTLTAEPLLRGLDGPRSQAPKSSIVDRSSPGTLLYSVCDTDDPAVDEGIDDGMWDVRMSVQHLSSGESWTSNSVSIEMDCSDGSGEGDTGPGMDAGDSGMADVSADTSVDTGAGDDLDSAGALSEGCTCATAGRGIPSESFLAFLTLFVVFCRRG